MADFLLCKGVHYINDANTQEITFEKAIHHEGKIYFARIYTSIDKRTKKTRDVGSDAIRVVIYNENYTLFLGEGRINRTQNWRINLAKRLENWTGIVKWCPQCKSPLRKRTGKYGLFYGCSTYPKCGYTESII